MNEAQREPTATPGVEVGYFEIQDLGLIDYDAAYRLQKDCVAQVIAGGPQRLLLCEHPAVITLGRLAKAENIFFSKEDLAAKGVQLVSIDRGGDVTLHAPGQLVVYPVLNLSQGRRDLKLYMQKLEEVAIDLLKSFDIVANRIFGKTGVFVGPDKIVSLGIGVKKWVTFHGLGININTDLKLFELINPCGLNVRMTSLAKLKGRPVEMADVKARLVESFKREFK